MLNLFLSVLLKYFIFKCFEYRNIVFVCFSALYLNFFTFVSATNTNPKILDRQI